MSPFVEDRHIETIFDRFGNVSIEEQGATSDMVSSAPDTPKSSGIGLDFTGKH